MAEHTRPPQGVSRPLGETTATRILWAAHILRYLGGVCCHLRSLAVSEPSPNLEFPRVEHDSDTESESQVSDLDDDDALDAETDRAATLSGAKRHEWRCKTKFLDALAELLSSEHGWAYVTAASLQEGPDSVTITVARNDGFAGDRKGGDGPISRDLVEKLGAYLSSNDAATPATGILHPFEVAMIELNRRRVEHWYDSIRHNVKSAHTTGNASEQAYLDGLEWTQRQWNAFCRTLLEGVPRQGIYATMLVSEAYSLRCVRLLARPLSDCRLLQSIATQLPQFGRPQIQLLSRRPLVTSLDRRPPVNITTALQSLVGDEFEELHHPTISRLQRKHGGEFLKDCASGNSFSQHAEILLLQHHWSTSSWPTLAYLGCSKKACLMCEEFLSRLDPPISTRGRHGVCYPAWGIPQSSLVSVSSALRALERSLVSRITMLLSQPTAKRSPGPLQNVPQSTVLSSLQDMVSELEKQRLLEKHAAQAEALRRGQQIIAGSTSVVQVSDSLGNLTAANSCVMCNELPARRCSRCRSSYYCSKDCQQSDWPLHKLLCKRFHQMPARPSPAHRRVIWFPVDTRRPKVEWVSCTREKDDDLGWFEVADVRSLLGPDSPVPGRTFVESNIRRKRTTGNTKSVSKLGYGLLLTYRDTFLLDGSALNKSIPTTTMAASGMGPSHPWAGPLVVVRQESNEMAIEDITLEDLRHAADYFVDYANKHTKDVEQVVPPTSPTVGTHCDPRPGPGHARRGVVIHCDGAIKLYGNRRFSQVDVPITHPAWSHSEMSPISRLMGVPVRLWKSGDISEWLDVPGWEEIGNAALPDSNQNAAFLMMGADPDADGWGWAPRRWQSALGDVLVVGDGGQDLDVEDVALLCYFCTKKLQPVFEDSMGAGLVPRSKEEVLEFITRENMERFRGEARRWMVET